MKSIVFCDSRPRSVVQIDGRFGGNFCLLNVGKFLQDYTASSVIIHSQAVCCKSRKVQVVTDVSAQYTNLIFKTLAWTGRLSQNVAINRQPMPYNTPEKVIFKFILRAKFCVKYRRPKYNLEKTCSQQLR